MAQLTNTQLSNILQTLSDITSAGITVDPAGFEQTLSKQLDIPELGRIVYKFDTYANIATTTLPSYVRAGDYVLISKDETHNQSPSLYMITNLTNPVSYEYRGTFDLNKYPTSAAVLVAFGKLLGDFQNSLPVNIKSVTGNVVDLTDPANPKININIPKTDEVGLTTVNDTIQLKTKKFNDGTVLSGVNAANTQYDDIATVKQKIDSLIQETEDISNAVDDLDVHEVDNIDIAVDENGNLTLKRRKVSTKNVMYRIEADNILYNSTITIKQAIDALMEGSSGSGGTVNITWAKTDDDTLTESPDHTISFKMRDFGDGRRVLNSISGANISFDGTFTLSEIIQSLIDNGGGESGGGTGTIVCNCKNPSTGEYEDFYITGNLMDLKNGIVYGNGVKSLGVTGAKMTTDGDGNIHLDIPVRSDGGGGTGTVTGVEVGNDIKKPDMNGVVHLGDIAGKFESISGNLVDNTDEANPKIGVRIKIGSDYYVPDTHFDIELPEVEVPDTPATSLFATDVEIISGTDTYVVEHNLDKSSVIAAFSFDGVVVDVPYAIDDGNNISVYLNAASSLMFNGQTMHVIISG